MQVLKGDNNQMGYTKNAVSGFSWQMVLKIGVAVITLTKIYFLARLLSPADFGLFSLITIALGVSEATTQTGVNVTIIQSKQSVSYFIDTAWVISIIRGMSIGIIMVLLGIVMSRFYQQPMLLGMIALASLVPAIKGFINPSIVKLQKELRFFEDSSYRLALVVVDGIAAVGLAWVFHSVVSLVLALIVAAIFEVMISQLMFKTRPKFSYLKSRGALILNNAKWLSFSALLTYLHENLDNLLIGKLTNTHQLGIYHNGYGLSHKANYEFAKSAIHGTFPIFTKLQGQTKRLLSAFLKSGGVTLLLVTATSAPLLLFPDFFVKLVLGDQWLEVIPLVRWLTLAGILQSMTSLIYNVLIAQGKYLLMNVHLTISVILLVVFIIIFSSNAGLLGAVIGVFLSRLVSLPIVIYGLIQLMNTKSGNRSYGKKH
jgi:lipopolysaccharide exporter